MDKTTVMVEFSLYGENFDLDEVTKKLGVIPSQTRIKGVVPEGKTVASIETSWSLSTEEEESYDINHQLEKIIDILRDKKDLLLKIQNDNNINSIFGIVIYIIDNQKPAIYFEPETLKFISDIEAQIGVDLYIYS